MNVACDRDKDGKCQFQQCNGKVVRGKVKDFDSYILLPQDTTTPRPSVTRPVTKPGGATTPKLPADTSAAPGCALDIDCKGKCGGKTLTDSCGHCGGNGDGCTSYSKDDVSNKLDSIFPANSTTEAVSVIKKFLPLTKSISRFQEITKAKAKFTVYIRLIGYSAMTFQDSDRRHLINFCNAMTGVVQSLISIDSVTDSPRQLRRRLQVEVGGSVDVTVTLDVSMIHDSSQNIETESSRSNRTGVVVAVVVVICCVAFALFVGVIVWYKINDRRTRNRKGRSSLEMEMTSFSQRKSDQYIQSNEPVLGSTNMHEG